MSMSSTGPTEIKFTESSPRLRWIRGVRRGAELLFQCGTSEEFALQRCQALNRSAEEPLTEEKVADIVHQVYSTRRVFTR